MKYSICIPVRNSVDYLKFAIQSVLDQTYSQFELIVVDNNSDRGVRDIIKDFNDPRIRYHRHQQTLPMAENWNSCFKLASGEWVSILHDDDRLKIDYLENIDRVLARHSDVGHVFCRVRYIDKYGKPLGIVRPKSDNLFGLFNNESYLKEISKHYFYSCPGVATKKDIAQKAQGFWSDLSLHMDYEFYVRVGLETKVFGIKDILAEYRIHENTIRWLNPEFTQKSVEDMIKWLQRIESLYISTGKSWAFQLAHTVFNIGLHSIVAILLSGDSVRTSDLARRMLEYKKYCRDKISLIVLYLITNRVYGIRQILILRRLFLRKKGLSDIVLKNR